MSRVFERLGAGEMALGVWLKGGPSWVPTIARAGFDFVRPDRCSRPWTGASSTISIARRSASVSPRGCACRRIRGWAERSRCRLRSTRSAHSVSASKSSVRPSRRRVRRAHAWMWRTDWHRSGPASIRIRTRRSRRCTRRERRRGLSRISKPGRRSRKSMKFWRWTAFAS